MKSKSTALSSETLIAVILFFGLLAFHGWGAGTGWKNLNLPGGEFRQSQTAISAYFIQRDQDFSLAYPTPILGKPWSVPFEFPLFQWTVVWLSDNTGLQLTQAGRTVNLMCFYLSLPAIYLLLGYLRLTWQRRLISLSFVLSCPLYIFYGRAFLIEMMALMFAVWFLVSYLRALENKSLGWLSLAIIAGTGAGLVKVTTFLFILMPAFAWTVQQLYQLAVSSHTGGYRPVIKLVTWGLGAVAIPCTATICWMRYAESIRALNATSDFLSASSMHQYYFGSGQRFAAHLWKQHAAVLFREIVSAPVLTSAALLAVLFARRWLGWIILLLGFFLAVQVIFPVLYAWHEYYYVANAFMLMLAIGLVAIGLLDSALPPLAAWGLILALHGGQIFSYLHAQYLIQIQPSNGGSPITQALLVATEPDNVLIIAGNDWSSIMPYFSQRRALMIRNGMEHDHAYLDSAFKRLNGESVGALIMHGAQRDNRELLERAVHDYGIDPRPVFTCLDATIYFHRRLRLVAIPLVKAVPDAQFITLSADSITDEYALVQREVELTQLPASHKGKFAGMSPMPFKYYTTYGAGRIAVGGQDLFSAHPDTRLWFQAPAGQRKLMIEAELMPGAYAESVPSGDRSDGIEIIISLEGPQQSRRPIFTRWLNPRDRPADRGLQTITKKFILDKDEFVIIEIGPGPQHNAARDWAVLGHIKIE